MDIRDFEINILDLYWINGAKNDPKDLCLHGIVDVIIGDEVIADKYDCTVSSTGLYLLKSLEEDHLKDKSLNQMLPCCGFFIIPNDVDEYVEISGCPNGIDWSVVHEENFVKLITEKGTEVSIDISLYKEIVFYFADKIQFFYNKCEKKIIPEDEFDKKGYLAFWREWDIRKNKKYNF